MANSFKVLIVGGGSGGISLAARLAKTDLKGSIGVVEPSREHFYQPLWTLIGAGIVPKEKSLRTEASVMPRGVKWIEDSVVAFHPNENTVECGKQGKIRYEVLVVANGLELNFEKISGLEGALGRDGLCSIYDYKLAEKTAEMIQGFKGGKAIFTMPPVPIKCAGAPQKIMYLADDVWRKSGVRDGSEIFFASAGPSIFGIKEFAAPLMEVIKRKAIQPLFSHKLIAVRPADKVAIFEVSGSATAGTAPLRKELSYDLLHVVPPMSAPRVIRESQLASSEESQKGWLEVDKYTLQHKRFANIFGVGDVTGVPNSKTGAAVRMQVPVVARNIACFLSGQSPSAQYNGYSSCPLVTGIGKVILAEFGYDGKLMPTFPLDPRKERRSYWHLKKDLLPQLYWHGMLKGLV